MAYDKDLASRFLKLLDGLSGVTEKRMMGGACFMVNGNMLGGADRTKSGDARFMFRVGKENDGLAARMTGGGPMIQGRRRLRGFYFVDADDHSEEVIREWLALAVRHATSLPPQ